MSITDGAVFAGYTIERLLGSGGMGEVYLARHPRLPRQEALKILPAGVSADPEYRERFAREANIASSLWHPHIVSVHDRGEENGQLWIAMDYVDGTDAAKLIRDRYPFGMPPEDVLDIVTAMAEALDYAHERYLLHRDVKPANILLTDPTKEDRRILLADFGIARGQNEVSGLTATNVTVGSVAYAAPEQLTGKTLDGRADQYALACTAFRLFSGKVPFSDSNPAVVIANHLSSPPPTLAAVRPDLARFDSVLAKAMSKEPYQRFGTCREFAAALSACRADVASSTQATQLAAPLAVVPTTFAPPTFAPPSVPVPPYPETPARSKSNRTPLIVGAAVAGLLAVGLVAFLGARLGQPQTESQMRPATVPTWPETIGAPETVTETADPITVTPSVAAPTAPPAQRTQTVPRSATGDLGVSQPISRPACNGQGIVILGSVTTPGMYEAGVQRLLDAHPGAFYLRTDQTCPSLRATNDAGNPIYAVFTLGGKTEREVCAAVRAAGGNAYGKWLDYTTDPGYIIDC